MLNFRHMIIYLFSKKSQLFGKVSNLVTFIYYMKAVLLKNLKCPAFFLNGHVLEVEMLDLAFWKLTQFSFILALHQLLLGQNSEIYSLRFYAESPKK